MNNPNYNNETYFKLKITENGLDFKMIIFINREMKSFLGHNKRAFIHKK